MKKNGMEGNPNLHFHPRNAGAIFALGTKLINLHMQWMKKHITTFSHIERSSLSSFLLIRIDSRSTPIDLYIYSMRVVNSHIKTWSESFIPMEYEYLRIALLQADREINEFHFFESYGSWIVHCDNNAVVSNYERMVIRLFSFLERIFMQSPNVCNLG